MTRSLLAPRDAARGGGPNLARALGPASAWDRACVDFAARVSGGAPLDETLDSGATIPALFAGRYRVLRPLGRGAAKEVYLVHDERLDRDVALALLTGGAAEARVRREMQVTGRLGEHPHVVTVHDAGEHDGLTYLVLRAVEGGSLAAQGRRRSRASESASGARWRTGSPTRMGTASSIATSSRTTSGSTGRARGARRLRGRARRRRRGLRDRGSRGGRDAGLPVAGAGPRRPRDPGERPLRPRGNAVRARLWPAAVRGGDRRGADRPAPARAAGAAVGPRAHRRAARRAAAAAARQGPGAAPGVRGERSATSSPRWRAATRRSRTAGSSAAGRR